VSIVTFALGRSTHRLATIHNVTDDYRRRQTQHGSISATASTVLRSVKNILKR